MVDEKKKEKHQDQETIKPDEGNKPELTVEELGKVSGGAGRSEDWIKMPGFEKPL